MPDDVKRRPYNSPARSQQALETRVRLLDAARRMFLDVGYRATTTAAVARAAGVSEASLFAAFGSKAELLVAVVVAEVRGTAGRLQERPEWKRLAAEPDKRRAIAAFARFVSRAHSRTWRLLAIVAAAAEEDAELKALFLRRAEARRDDCLSFATTVLGLPADARETAAKVDAVWAQSSVDVYRHLVIQRRWSARRYEQWLTRVLTAELLAHSARGSGPRA